VERGNHEELYAARGRYFELYTKQQGLVNNLFLAPGEGDTAEASVEGANGKGRAREDAVAETLRLVRGE
jgi:subfamily B ATP-binding cassette protein MsbA